MSRKYPKMIEICCGLALLGLFLGFHPIGNNGSQKFKGMPNFSGDEIQKFCFHSLCALLPTTRIQNFRLIG